MEIVYKFDGVFIFELEEDDIEQMVKGGVDIEDEYSVYDWVAKQNFENELYYSSIDDIEIDDVFLDEIYMDKNDKEFFAEIKAKVQSEDIGE